MERIRTSRLARPYWAPWSSAAGHAGAAAQKLIAEVLEVSPHDDDALIMRANLSLAHGDPTSAVVDLRAVLRDQPRSVQVLQRALARAAYCQGSARLAEETLRAGSEAVPEECLASKIELAQIVDSDRPTLTGASPVLEGLMRNMLRTITEPRAGAGPGIHGEPGLDAARRSARGPEDLAARRLPRATTWQV